MKDIRREKLEKQLESLESEYRVSLLRALHRCAGGHWGLFGQNDHVPGAPKSDDASALLTLGDEISELRDRLGHSDSFALHDRFLAERGRQHANRLGEPKIAQAWLGELGKK
jgi:hypothetical protein